MNKNLHHEVHPSPRCSVEHQSTGEERSDHELSTLGEREKQKKKKLRLYELLMMDYVPLE